MKFHCATLVLPLLLLVTGCGTGTQGGQGSITFSGPAGLLSDTAPWDALETGEDVVLDWNHTSGPDDSDGATLLRDLEAAYVMRTSGDFDDGDGSGWSIVVSITPYTGEGTYDDEAIAVTFDWIAPRQGVGVLSDDQPRIQVSAVSGCSATIEADTLLGQANCTSVALTLDEASVSESYEIAVVWEASTTPFR